MSVGEKDGGVVDAPSHSHRVAGNVAQLGQGGVAFVEVVWEDCEGGLGDDLLERPGMRNS